MADIFAVGGGFYGKSGHVFDAHWLFAQMVSYADDCSPTVLQERQSVLARGAAKAPWGNSTSPLVEQNIAPNLSFGSHSAA